MNLATMTSMIRTNIDDANGTRYTDEVMRDFINQALDDVYNRLLSEGSYPARYTVDVTILSDTQEIALTFLFAQAVTVKYKDSGTFNYRDQFLDIVEEEKCVRSGLGTVYITSRLSGIDTRTNYLGWPIKASSNIDLTLTYAPQIHYAPGLLSYDPDSLENTRELGIIDSKFHGVLVARATVLSLGVDEQNVQFHNAIYEQRFADMQNGIEQNNPRDQGVVDVYN